MSQCVRQEGDGCAGDGMLVMAAMIISARLSWLVSDSFFSGRRNFLLLIGRGGHGRWDAVEADAENRGTGNVALAETAMLGLSRLSILMRLGLGLPRTWVG